MNRPASVAITGASGGIGRALALAYARPGTTLALSGRDGERLEAVAAACRDRGATVTTCRFDVTDPQACRRWIETADAARPLDLVIANAGVSGGLGPDGAAEPVEVAQRILAINVGGVFNVVNPAIDRMLPRHAGSIALIGSLAGLKGLPSSPAYSASKAAIHSWGDALRGWLAPQGIHVTIIAPGYVDSPMSARVRGPRPFCIDADRAAAIIHRAIDRRRAMVAFPWPLALGLRLLGCLPAGLADRLLRPFLFTVDPDPRLTSPPPQTPDQQA
jgi:short-subunit dehydrogenase